MNHESIIKFYQFFQHNNEVFIVLEYAENGNLFNYIRKKTYQPLPSKIRKMFWKICEGVEYIHRKGFIHRDLKPENILLDKNFNPKICDFGWSAGVESTGRETFCGTYEYIPPEIFESEAYDQKVDVWSLGILLFEMFHKKSPFQDKSIFKIYRKQIENKFSFKEDLGEAAKDLILAMLNTKANSRPTLSQVLRHAFFHPEKKGKFFRRGSNNTAMDKKTNNKPKKRSQDEKNFIPFISILDHDNPEQAKPK